MRHDFAWVPMDVRLHMNPKVRRAGHWALEIYTHALRLVGLYRTDGVVLAHHLSAESVARDLMLPTDENQLAQLNAGCAKAVEENLLRVDDEGNFFVVGWRAPTGDMDPHAHVRAGDRARDKYKYKYKSKHTSNLSSGDPEDELNSSKRKAQVNGNDPTTWSAELRSALPVAERVIARLNEQAGTRYGPVKVHVQRIQRLLRDGYTEKQIRAVVWWKCEEWKHKADMRAYLRPQTLFGPENFADYVGQAMAEYERRLNGESVDWSDGAEA